MLAKQVALIVFSGSGLDETRMHLLRLTVELYMGLTNRNMHPWHTPTTLIALQAKMEQWLAATNAHLGVLRKRRQEKGMSLSGLNLNIPKVHDMITHMIPMISLRGILPFFSTEA